MKRTLIILSLFFTVTFITACSFSSEVDLKEKCAGYLQQEQSRYYEECCTTFDWIKYSKTLNTCVSRWYRYGVRYYDVLSGEEIKVFVLGDEESEDVFKQRLNNYESTLRLL